MKEGLLILYAEEVLAPTPFLSKFTNLISELPLAELVCILLTKFLKLSDLRQTQFSPAQHLPLSNCGFHFGQTNTPITSASCAGSGDSHHVSSSELQSWAARASP